MTAERVTGSYRDRKGYVFTSGDRILRSVVGGAIGVQRELIESKRAQWNPETKEWDHFPDNAAQLGTLRHVTKLHEIDPPKEPEDKATAVAVMIHTNLDDPRMANAEPAGTIIATVPISSEASDEA